jgi:hypothetical protein
MLKYAVHHFCFDFMIHFVKINFKQDSQLQNRWHVLIRSFHIAYIKK